MNEDKEFVTLTVKSNLFEPLYMNRDYRLSFDEKEAIAWGVSNSILTETIIKFMKGEDVFSEKIASSNIELEIETIYEKADLTKFPIRQERYGRVIYCQLPTLKVLIAEQKEKIKEIEEEIRELEDQIDTLESEKDDLECVDLEKAKTNLAELERKLEEREGK